MESQIQALELPPTPNLDTETVNPELGLLGFRV